MCTDENGSKITEENAAVTNGNNGDANDSNATEQTVSSYICGMIFNQNIDTHLNSFWILLDSESTNNTLCNHLLLAGSRNITNGEYLRTYSNGGYMDSTHKGCFRSIDVWYNPRGLANILSLALVTEMGFRVTMDSLQMH